MNKNNHTRNLFSLKVRHTRIFCEIVILVLTYDLHMNILGVPVLSVEAATTSGWAKYSHMQIGIDRFGKSAPTLFIKNGKYFRGDGGGDWYTPQYPG